MKNRLKIQSSLRLENCLPNRIKITDDFDLEKIMDSGQNFRAWTDAHGTSQFITGNHLLLIRPLGEQEYAISAEKATWERIWVPYFDLKRDYRSVRQRAMAEGGYLKKAAEFGEGIRILRQDPWEMLVTFILSQRKSVPAIRTAIRVLVDEFATAIASINPKEDSSSKETYDPLWNTHGREDDLRSDLLKARSFDRLVFPRADALLGVSEQQFRDLGFGYRSPYLVSAVEQVASGALPLSDLDPKSDEEMLSTLQQVKGVGIKVARCVLLYGYGRMRSAPVDVWIQRAIDQHFEGVNVFEAHGEDAGIWQQYVFYAMRKRMKFT